MTLIPLTDCCRLLAIDGKTQRRWLAQAQLPVEAHPSDARCKGLSSDHLLLLASAHHRRLTGLPPQYPAPASTAPPPELPELLAELLTALQTLSALPAQMTAVQQQVADLTALVQQQQPRLAVTSPKTQRRAARVGAPAYRYRFFGKGGKKRRRDIVICYDEENQRLITSRRNTCLTPIDYRNGKARCQRLFRT